MNSVDRLFEQVLSDIGTNGLDNSPDWQNNEFEYDETDDWLDNISSDGQEDVYSIDAMLNRDRVSDRVFNRGSPIIGVSPE